MGDWTDPAFLHEAEAWVQAHARVVGPIEQTHVQIWSTVLRVPTDEGTLWFKAPEGASEARLTASWLRSDPTWSRRSWRSTPTAGWMLLRDAGTRLREILDADPNTSVTGRRRSRRAQSSS